jgi:hypothetical protein
MSLLSCLFFLLAAFAVPLTTTGQNLVSNGGFEKYVNLPTNYGQFSSIVTGWSGTYTPDFFHAQAAYPVSTQMNFAGSQMPCSDMAYAGILMDAVPSWYREQIQSPLSFTMEPGNEYFFRIAFSFSENSQWAVDKLCLRFTTSAPTGTLIDNFAHICVDTVVTDRDNWTILEGSFIADSAYKHVVVGNFFSNFNRVYTPGSYNFSYYFVDDLCVSSNSIDCNPIVLGIGGSSQDDLFSDPDPVEETELDFYDMSGRQVAKGLPNEVLPLLPAGMYVGKSIGRKPRMFRRS